mmetsp:Transcript_83643/g.190914  ORF Transcript_83643/g.190914 Transcript_83643/m.190914 type:complete len:167 (-) Transcript_83643:172-672(-)
MLRVAAGLRVRQVVTRFVSVPASRRGFAQEAFLGATQEAVPEQSFHFAETTASNAASNCKVRLTDAAADRLRQLHSIGKPSTLRLRVASGGCSGFQYEFTFSEPEDGDLIYSQDGATLVVDEQSAEFLDGAEIGFEQEMIRASFVMQKNLLADAKCGCGSSFSVGF